MSADRLCLACGRELTGPLATRSDKRYCNSSCRSLAFRDDRLAQARDVADLLRDDAPAWPDDGVPDAGTGWRATERAAAAEATAEALTASLNGRPRWLTRVAQLSERRPDLARAFGAATLVAHARPLPAGTCRGCAALAYAKVHRLPLPRLGEGATRALLGQPCPRCLAATRQALVASVHPPSARDTAATLVAEPVHSAGCDLCSTARELLTARHAVTASAMAPPLKAALDRAFVRHRPVTARHDGRDGACNCERCRRARVEARRAR